MKKPGKRVRTVARIGRKSRKEGVQHTLSGAEEVILHPGPSSAPRAQKQAEMAKEAESLARVNKVMCEAFGVEDPQLADLLLTQADALQVWGNFKNAGDKVMTTLAFMQAIKPTGVTEALLATQMLGVHHAALMFLRRATLDDQTMEGSDANAIRAARLLRLFNEQLDAMAKLKGKAGQQRVTVEHVHVHQGGQAIVGAVSTAKPTGGRGQLEETRTNTP